MDTIPSANFPQYRPTIQQAQASTADTTQLVTPQQQHPVRTNPRSTQLTRPAQPPLQASAPTHRPRRRATTLSTPAATPNCPHPLSSRRALPPPQAPVPTHQFRRQATTPSTSSATWNCPHPLHSRPLPPQAIASTIRPRPQTPKSSMTAPTATPAPKYPHHLLSHLSRTIHRHLTRGSRQ